MSTYTVGHALSWSIDIAEALRYLHDEAHLVHRDVKPMNVLLHDDRQRAVLSDFGLTENQNTKAATQFGGTIAYMPPEVLKQSVDYKADSCYQLDVYSFGVLLCELFTAEKPYWNMTSHQVKQEVPEGLRPALPEVDAELKKTIAVCLSADPWMRPTPETMLSMLRKIRDRLSPEDLARPISNGAQARTTSSSGSSEGRVHENGLSDVVGMLNACGMYSRSQSVNTSMLGPFRCASVFDTCGRD